MNLRDLEYLVAVAEHRHFGRAAQACFVSQPTLSTQLKKLETELGVPLVERAPRQVMLTRAGEQIVERARSVLADVADIKGIAHQAADPRSGSLRLGMFPTLGPYVLPHLTGPLHEHFPSLELLLVEEQTHVLLDRLRDGSLDAALIAIPSGDDSLHVEPLFDEDFVAAVPEGHLLALPDQPLRSADIAREKLLLLTEGHCLRDQALAVCGTGATHAPMGGFEATSLETLRHMVAAGVGMTLLPRLSVSSPVAQTPGIALREFAAPRPHRTIGLHWRPSTIYRTLLPELADVIRQLPSELVTPIRPT